MIRIFVGDYANNIRAALNAPGPAQPKERNSARCTIRGAPCLFLDPTRAGLRATAARSRTESALHEEERKGYDTWMQWTGKEYRRRERKTGGHASVAKWAGGWTVSGGICEMRRARLINYFGNIAARSAARIE